MAGGALSVPQNPGIGGLDELTSSEELFVQGLASLSYQQGDILYYTGSALTRLAIGTANQQLRVNAGATAPEWATISSSGTGDVVGPSSSVDNTIVRFDGTTGKLVQGYTSGGPTISDTGAITATQGGSLTGTWSDLGTVSTIDINGGTLDGVVIGGASAAAATFTTATAQGFIPTSSTATGNRLYLPAANTIGFSINGTGALQLTATALSPISDGGLSLGTTALGWQNLFANTGFVLNIENSNWVATHTSGILTVGTGDLRITTAGTNAASVATVGGSQILTNKQLTSATINTIISPTSDDGAPLGDTTHNFSDLFLASGAVINYANSNVVITHTSGILTMGTGDLRITNAGTNSASVVTVGGSQTLTGKTLTSPTLTTPSAFTTGGTITLAENTSVALNPAGSADGKYSGITVTGTGGATIAFGDLVTLDKDDSRWELVDISVAAAATGDARGIIGIAVSTSTDGNPITVLLHGIIRADAAFPTLTIGAAVYASTTGDVVVTQPSTTDHVIRVIGYGLTADEMYFFPENDWITHT